MITDPSEVSLLFITAILGEINARSYRTVVFWTVAFFTVNMKTFSDIELDDNIDDITSSYVFSFTV